MGDAADNVEEEEFTLRGYIQTLTRLSKPAFEKEDSKIEDWVRSCCRLH
jgi:hypothetical protein